MTDTARLVIAVDSSGAAKATANLDKLDRAAGNTERAANKLGKAWGVAVGLISSAVIIGATRAFIRQADVMANLSAKVKLVTGDMESAAAAQRDLFELSQKTSSDLEATTELYVKLGQSSKELAGNHALLLGITEKVSKALVISGADAASSAAVIRQFSQAMAAGSLRGDEFISVMEGAPRLARAIADGMGVAVGSLRKMAAEGKLTSAEIIKALEDQGATLDQEFGEMPLTVGRATQQVRNALTQLIGDTDKTSGATKGLSQAIADLARTLESPEVREGFASLISGLVSVVGTAAQAAAGMANFARWVGESAARAQGFTAMDDIAGVQDRLAKVNKALEQRNSLAGRVAQIVNGMTFNAWSPLQSVEDARLLGTSTEDLEAEKRKLESFVQMQERMAALANRPSFANVTGTATGSWESSSDPANPAGPQIIRDRAKATQEATQSYADWIAQAMQSVPVLQEIDRAEREAAEAKAQGIEATDRLLADMRYEIEIARASGDEKERLIALRYADAHATDEQKRAVGDLAIALKRAHEEEQNLEDVKNTFKDLFVDLSDDSESASRDLDRFFDRLKQKAAEVVADRAINALFNMLNNKAGSGGGWISSLLSAFGFGGGRAGEGQVMAGHTYRVGESGAELFTPATNGTVSKAGGQVMKPVFNMTFVGAPSQPEVSSRQNPSGGFDITAVFKQIKSDIAGDIASGTGDITRAFKGRYGLREMV